MKNFRLATILLALLLAASRTAPAAEDLNLKEEPGQHLDVRLGDRVLVRYMHAFDTSTPERREETNKPYLHVFDPEGRAPITNGPGGLYPHHRGIFIGWTRIGLGGKKYNFWGMGDSAQIHQKYLQTEADANRASFTSLVSWESRTGETILVEERTQTVFPAPSPACLAIDFTTRLAAPNGEVTLDGDPEHGGVQYRPADAMDRKQTLYVFPVENPQPTSDLDYPWVGETYLLGEARYSVVVMNHPSNPKGTRFSAYRDYGRVGAFIRGPIKPGEPLTLKYRFLIAAGQMPPASVIQASYNQFAGTNSAPPKTAVRLSDQPAAKK